MSDNVVVVELYPVTYECVICGAETQGKHGLARYEDQVVPDDYEGEWGGAPACALCYVVAGGLQAAHPGRIILFDDIRRLVAEHESVAG